MPWDLQTASRVATYLRTSRPGRRCLDVFCGEGGASVGYARAGFDVFGVDNDPERLALYPYANALGDAVDFIATYGHLFDFIHGSPTCTGYSNATIALPDRMSRYDRLIAVTREAMLFVGKPYVIENVESRDVRAELRDPIRLCGRHFGLAAVDTDGTPLVMDRHRLFESSVPLVEPDHPKHDKSLQVGGSYGGARRDKIEARTIRKGGYVPRSVDVQRTLLGTPWMSERGCQLSIPPVYAETVGAQVLTYLQERK